MDYTPLLEQVLAQTEGNPPLAELIGRVDALYKSIPTLEELNSALSRLGRESATASAYASALSEHQIAVAQALESGGVSAERQKKILQRYAALRAGHDA